ncbi:MAG: RnfABCDGE type electron transport complex subunit C [Acholeplasmataceae bacterium]|jgi:electron transport complex protein RnfC
MQLVKTKIVDNKKSLVELPTETACDSEKLYYPVISGRCPVGRPCVEVGDRVLVGQLIGVRQGSFFDQEVHATVSGTVLKNEKKVDQSGKLVDCMVVENDFKYEEFNKDFERSDEEISKLTHKEFVDIAHDAGLVGLGGAAFPSYIKLNTDEEIKVVVANGAECEPFLISDYKFMDEFPEKVILGLSYVMQAVNAPEGVIAIKKKHKTLIAKLEEKLQEFPHLNIRVAKIRDFYPAGWEIQTVKLATGVNVPVGTIMAKSGVLNFNTTTLGSFYEAVKFGRPLTFRYFTIAGDGIQNMAFRVRLGTPVRKLIEMAGGYLNKEVPKVLVLGGPMMGTNVTNDDIVVTDTTTSLLVFNQKEVKEDPCIMCASCIEGCPVGLDPVLIMKAQRARDKDTLMTLDVNKCIECGLCSYICPSKIPLTEEIKKAKKTVGR